MISRMQREEYRQRLQEAAEVLQQAPGSTAGDRLGEEEPAAA
ncbi:MAG TPA: hypothetical protein VHG69_09110 [Thermoleophilaceae bacterium]|nr:hypothetical protein [Thermoleophilaceae bacterium]